MDTEKSREYLSDVTSTGEAGSNCCGAAMYELGDDFICQDCGEHCEPSDEEVDNEGFSPEQLKLIERLKEDAPTEI